MLDNSPEMGHIGHDRLLLRIKPLSEDAKQNWLDISQPKTVIKEVGVARFRFSFATFALLDDPDIILNVYNKINTIPAETGGVWQSRQSWTWAVLAVEKFRPQNTVCIYLARKEV